MNVQFALLVTIAVLLAIGISFSIWHIVEKSLNERYRSFLLEHSVAIQKMNALNQETVFLRIPNLNLMHSYDNADFYENVSEEDYLIYSLVSMQKDVLKAFADAKKNKDLYDKYIQSVCQIKELHEFDTVCTLKNQRKLLKTEKQLLNQIIQQPTIDVPIGVTLCLTTLNDYPKETKIDCFSESEIRSLINRINKKRGTFYLDDQIWLSICRVERARVSNKLRFEIYERDNYRCRKCGSAYELQIDHIIPISKGGKSEYNNLQTLCKNCNCVKGNKIELNNKFF